jgi:hypothetical protein
MEYNPVKDGEFPKTYTTKQIHQHQKESLSLRLKKPTHKNHLLLKEESEPSSQYPVQNEEHSSPIKELTMADLKTSLGPGSYQVQDKDVSNTKFSLLYLKWKLRLYTKDLFLNWLLCITLVFSSTDYN